MTRDQFACQCPSFGWGLRPLFECGRRATQEDQMCDECRQYCDERTRPGVAYYVGGGPNGGHPVPVGDIEIFG